MTHFIRRRRWTAGRTGNDDTGLRVIGVALLAGAAAGGFFGCFMSGTQPGSLAELAAGAPPRTVLAALVWPGLLFLGAAVFSTSFLGVLLEPALAFLGSFMFSHCVSVMYASCGTAGLRWAFFTVGIPALFWLPAFGICVYGGFSSARRLWALSFGYAAGARCAVSPLLATGISLAALAACTVYGLAVLPALLS